MTFKVLKPFNDSQDNVFRYGNHPGESEYPKEYPHKGYAPTPERIETLINGGFIEASKDPEPIPETPADPPQDAPEQRPEPQEQPESESPRRRYRR